MKNIDKLFNPQEFMYLVGIFVNYYLKIYIISSLYLISLPSDYYYSYKINSYDIVNLYLCKQMSLI